MTALIVSYADLGRQENLHTDRDAAAFAILKRILPTRMICRSYTGNKKNIAAVFPLARPILGGLYTLRNILPIDTRYYTRKIFDFFASRHINQDIKVLYGQANWLRCVEKMNRQGGVTISELCGRPYPFEDDPSIIPRTAFNTNVREVVRKSKYLIVPSHYVKDVCVEHGIPSKKIFVVNYGVDVTRFSPQKRKEKVFRVIMVANFLPLKGLKYLLQAWEELELPNAELVLLGNKPRVSKRLIRDAQQRGQNILSVPHQDPAPWFAKSSVAVLPSLTDAWAKVVTEAMASGLPVIITENTGAKDAVTEGQEGFIIPIKNYTILKKRLRYLYDHPDKRTRMGRQARKTVLKSFTWKHYQKRFQQAIEKTLQNEGLL